MRFGDKLKKERLEILVEGDTSDDMTIQDDAAVYGMQAILHNYMVGAPQPYGAVKDNDNYGEQDDRDLTELYTRLEELRAQYGDNLDEVYHDSLNKLKLNKDIPPEESEIDENLIQTEGGDDNGVERSS